MIYINKKTRAMIDSPSVISGGNWEEYKDEVVVDSKPDNVDVEDSVPDDVDELTKKDIMQELDAFGIEYNPEMTKDELYNLMVEGR